MRDCSRVRNVTCLFEPHIAWCHACDGKIGAHRSLAEWAEWWGVKVVSRNGKVLGVIDADFPIAANLDLFSLTDYRAASLSGGFRYLVPR